MTKSEEYREEAAKAQMNAEAESDPAGKAKLYKLAEDWTDLALTAEVHAQLDAVVVERGGRSNPIDWE